MCDVCKAPIMNLPDIMPRPPGSAGTENEATLFDDGDGRDHGHGLHGAYINDQIPGSADVIFDCIRVSGTGHASARLHDTQIGVNPLAYNSKHVPFQTVSTPDHFPHSSSLHLCFPCVPQPATTSETILQESLLVRGQQCTANNRSVHVAKVLTGLVLQVTWVAMIICILFFEMSLAMALWTGLIVGLAYTGFARAMYRTQLAAIQREVSPCLTCHWSPEGRIDTVLSIEAAAAREAHWW